MSQVTVLIADDNEVCCIALKTCFEQHGFQVFDYVNNGTDVIERVKQHNVDVLIMDLVLPRLDGCEVLERLNQMELSHRPNIFIHTALSADRIINYALKHGALYFFAKPTQSEVVYRRIVGLLYNRTDLVETPAAAIQAVAGIAVDRVRETATQLIRSVGIPAHIKGYYHLRAAIEYLVNNEESMSQIRHFGMTTHVYPEIAKNFGTSPSRVERNIRNAIEVAWNRGNIETLHQMFGYTVNDKKGRPTNSEFIAMLADRTQMMLL
ncbi:MAG: sporulation transcription factor Spo0A [Bacillota bacterium]